MRSTPTDASASTRPKSSTRTRTTTDDSNGHIPHSMPARAPNSIISTTEPNSRTPTASTQISGGSTSSAAGSGDSEYWKINGIRGISQELKERVFWQNYEELFAGRG